MSTRHMSTIEDDLNFSTTMITRNPRVLEIADLEPMTFYAWVKEWRRYKSQDGPLRLSQVISDSVAMTYGISSGNELYNLAPVVTDGWTSGFEDYDQYRATQTHIRMAKCGPLLYDVSRLI